jgi:hypothetical protein
MLVRVASEQEDIMAPSALVAPCVGVILPDGATGVSILAFPGTVVHAIAAGAVRSDVDGQRLTLETSDSVTWTYAGVVRREDVVDSIVDAGQGIATVADSPRGALPSPHVSLSAVDSHGNQIDLFAVLPGLPDPTAITPTPTGSWLGPDPDDTDRALAEPHEGEP